MSVWAVYALCVCVCGTVSDEGNHVARDLDVGGVEAS